MFSKFYEFLVPTFPDLSLCMSDTDSFLFSCSIPKNKELVQVLKENEEHFDFSNLAKDGRFGKTLFSLDHKNELHRYYKDIERYIASIFFFNLSTLIFSIGSRWNQKTQKLLQPVVYGASYMLFYMKMAMNF